MSAIKAKLQEDIKQAMKAREQGKLTTLRGISSAVKQVEIDTRKELDDAAVIAILQKEVKKRRDALQFAQDAKREDLIEQNKTEIELIQSYLGEQLSEEQLRALISGFISAGANDMRAIMTELNKEHKGKFEGKIASELAKALLSSSGA